MISRTKKVAYVLAFLLSVLYLIWRVFYTLPWHGSIWILIFAILLVFSEIISNITAYIVIYFRLRVTKKKISNNLEDQDYLPGVPVPDIDMIVATHDEDPALLRKTFNAIKYIEYPDKSKVHLVVADDGNRPEVAALTAEYGGRYIGLSGNKEAKSGNINHALTLVNSPLVAIFDADMIPYSSFLDATVPIFMHNLADQAKEEPEEEPLGFIQTPQSFYNADIFQFNLFSEKSVPNEQDYFSRDINVLNSMNGAAIFTGSNTVFLRQAIDDAGGFPVDTLTEDFELGGRINMAGYTSYSTRVPQASGISPVDVKGVIKQRVRWARGVIQSSRNMRIFWNRKLSFNNRLILINYLVASFVYPADQSKSIKHRLRLIFRWFMVSAVSVVPFVVWLNHVKSTFTSSKHQLDAAAFSGQLNAEGLDYMRDIAQRMLDASLQWSSLSTLVMLGINVVMFTTWFILLYKGRPSILLKQLVLLDFIFVLYCISIFAMYLVSMPYDEAIVLAGYERYLSTIVILLLFLAAGMLVRTLDDNLHERNYDKRDLKSFRVLKNKRLYQRTAFMLWFFAIIGVNAELGKIQFNERLNAKSLPVWIDKVTPEEFTYNDKHVLLVDAVSEEVTSYYAGFVGKYYFFSPNVDAQEAFDYSPEDFKKHNADYDYVLLLEGHETYEKLTKKVYNQELTPGLYQVQSDKLVRVDHMAV
ncbi:glycosyltransferase family 2 protein [Weissella tructae]